MSEQTALSELLSIYIDKIEYEESPFFHDGCVTFTPSFTVCTDETEKLDRLYDWGLIIYEEEAGRNNKIETIQMGIDYDSIDLTRTFKLNKSELNLDYNNYIAKNDKKYSIGSYVVYKEGGEMVESDVLVPIELVYDNCPSLKITDLKLGAYEGNEMDGQQKYTIRLEVTGALWMDHIHYHYDDMWNPGGPIGSISPSDKENYTYNDIRYFGESMEYRMTWFFCAIVNGIEISSNKLIHGCTWWEGAYIYIT